MEYEASTNCVGGISGFLCKATSDSISAAPIAAAVRKLDPDAIQGAKGSDTTGFSRVVIQGQPKTEPLETLEETTGFSRVVTQIQPTLKNLVERMVLSPHKVLGRS